jgi:dipeptidyl aminopeptidase/acylaminoacyl peptidase
MSELSRRLFLRGLIVGLVLVLSAPVALLAQGIPEGHWEGAVSLPNGVNLQVAADFQKADGNWQGTLDIPQQGAKGRPLQSIKFEAPAIHFEIQVAPGQVVAFDGKLDGDKIAGSFQQGGVTLPFTLERRVAAAPVKKDLPEGMIPREVLFGNPVKASPELSPDGKKLAYLAPQNGVLNVWVKTIGQNDDQVITADKKRGIRVFLWQLDGERILYIQDKDGDENFHLYQTSLKTRKTRDLTPFDGIRAELVAYNPRFPDQALIGLNLDDPRLHDVYRLDLKTGGLELDTKNPGDVNSWTEDTNLVVRIAEVVTPDGGAEIRIRDDAKSPWRVLTKWGANESFGGVSGFTPDNKAVWLISSVDANAARLLELDVAEGKSKVIVEDSQYDVERIQVQPKTRKLEAVAIVRSRTEWKVVDPSVQADFDVLRRVRDANFNISSRDLADKTWLVTYVSDDAPVSYYSYNRATKQATFLFTNRPALEKYKLAKMQPISFSARDRMTIYGYVTLPNREPKNLPMVLLVHGGPWARDVWGLSNTVQWLANRGYAVLQINYRGSTGYGKKYLNAGDREWAGKMHTDLLDAKAWILQKGYVDPKRICIMGGSYGGYATLVGVSFTPDEFACGVDIVGPSNLVTLLKSIPPYWEPVRALFRKRLGNEETEADFLKSRSPLFKADQIKAPLLIGQGANDPRVKQAESDQIVAAMRKNREPVEYIVFPDEGHGFVRPENSLRFFAAADQFLGKYLGGAVEPPSPQEDWSTFKK